MVQNLIHPSMYPFVFGMQLSSLPATLLETRPNHRRIEQGRSSFIFEEVVDRENAFASVGKGSIVPEITRLPDYGSRFMDMAWQLNSIGVVPPEYRSSLYQWLPTNVVFREDGTAKLTSYVNNLHPRKYPAIYEAIEHAIDAAIPAWDQCLRENLGYRENIVAGRDDSRFDLVMDARYVFPQRVRGPFRVVGRKMILTDCTPLATKTMSCGQAQWCIGCRRTTRIDIGI